MADSLKLSADTAAYALVLDADEAGYLRELLYTAVGGNLVCYGQPLGRILEALERVNSPRRSMRNLNDEAPLQERRSYASLYAAGDPEADEWTWWENRSDPDFEDDSFDSEEN